MRLLNLGPFGGPVSALDSRAIDALYAQDTSNYRYEDGKLLPRYGFRNLDGIPTDFSSVHGMGYLQGYTSADALAEEYLTAERLSTHTAGKCKIYSRNVTTGAETEVTTSAPAAVELTNTGDWRFFAWDDLAYLTNPNETISVYRKTLGTAASLVGLGVPVPPTTQLAMAQTFNASGGTLYDTMLFSGQDASSAGEVAMTGLATNTGSGSSSTDGSMRVRHSAGSGGGAASFQADLSDGPGNQDWQYVDRVAFTLTEHASGAFKIDPASIQVQAINNTPTTFTMEVFAERVGSSNVIRVYATCLLPKTRASWATIEEFKVSYNVTQRSGTASNNDLTISKVHLGCTFPAPVSERTPGTVVTFGYDYGVNSTSLFSGIGGVLDVPVVQLRGYDPIGGFMPLGVFPRFTSAASGEGTVDRMRLFWYDDRSPAGNAEDPFVWRQIVSQDDATTTYTLKMDFSEMIALTARAGAGGFKPDKCVAGIPFKGWVAWLYQGGSNNVRHSRVGLPESQASDDDADDDSERGENYSLADNFGDEPVNGCQADDALLIAGSNGVYAQLGDRPSQMTFFRKVGNYGVPGYQACCRAVVDGIPGLAALARDGEGVYFYPGIAGVSVPTDYQATELTQGIRPSLKSFLLDAQSLTNWTTAILQYEPNTDALWLIVGARAMVLRRPSLVDGKRHWEFYRYGMDGSETIKYAVASTRRRMKWFRSHGKFDENEYRFDTSAYIDGSTRDGGNAMPSSSIFWKAKRFNARNAGLPRAYVGWTRIARTTMTNTPTVTISARDRGTNTDTSKTLASGRVDAWFGTRTIGEEFDVAIYGSEGDAAISGLEVEFHPAGAKRRT